MRISDWSSDVCSSDLQNVAKFAMKDSGVKSYASFVANNPFGVGMEIQTCEQLKKVGAECSTTVRYRQGKSDYRPEIGSASCRERVGQYVKISVVDVS